jgi:hypothetical protein
MGTLLETIGIVLEIHFRFGFLPNESPVGDSLTPYIKRTVYNIIYFLMAWFVNKRFKNDLNLTIRPIVKLGVKKVNYL